MGGKTGRDGCGGATRLLQVSRRVFSGKLRRRSAERATLRRRERLQRLFEKSGGLGGFDERDVNDFGAGGVSVAIGELADGLLIDLNKVPKKYEGLDGTELAISESQERMAVVVAEKDVDRFCKLAREKT